MTGAHTPVAAPTWAPWSPSRLTSRTKIPRRYLQIPGDQQKLLDRPAAWSVGGLPNVPLHVLEDAKTHLGPEDRPRSPVESTPVSELKIIADAVSAHARRVELSCRAESPARSTAGDEDASGDTSAGADGNGDEENESSEGTPIPWSPTPSRHLRGPCRQESSPAPGSSGISGISGISVSRRSSTQHDPPAAGNLVAQALQFDFPPSSSLASGSELEVELPKAITDVPEQVVSRNPATVLEPTPPSAQVIPCTITEQSSPARTPGPKRRCLMKPVLATCFSSPKAADQARLAESVPATATATAVSGPSRPAASATTPQPGILPSYVSTTPLEVPSTTGRHTPSPARLPDVMAFPSEPGDKQGSSNDPDKPPPNGPPSQVPFTAFRTAYPDYTGSLGDFIRSVICILSLQKKKSLAEFLYDDFVRVFSWDYLEYISTLGDSRSALTAIQFYNENVSRPLYMKGVLTKDNIKDIPDKYPEKTRAIQHNVGLSQSSPSPLSAGPIHAPPPTGLSEAVSSTNPQRVAREDRLPAGLGPVPEQQRGARSIISRVPISAPPSAYRPNTETNTSAIAAGAIGSRLSASRTQIDSSPPDEAMAPPTSGAAEVPPPSTAFSTISHPDSIPERPRKRKGAPRASAGSSAGGPGTQSKRATQTAEDLEKRALRFRKFLIRKLAQSSAPEGSSPQPPR